MAWCPTTDARGHWPTETAEDVDPSYTTAHVTSFATNHRGDDIRRIIARCRQFIEEHPAHQNTGINIHTLPLVTVGVGVGVTTAWTW